MYTKGKWTYCQYYDAEGKVAIRGFIVTDVDGSIPVADMEGPVTMTLEEWEANAHLIASAPALYEALKILYNSDPDIPVALLNQVQEALAKAEGKKGEDLSLPEPERNQPNEDIMERLANLEQRRLASEQARARKEE